MSDPVYRLDAAIFIESDKDPEEVATTMSGGLAEILHQSFPDGIVIGADVESIRPAGAEELNERGLVE